MVVGSWLEGVVSILSNRIATRPSASNTTFGGCSCTIKGFAGELENKEPSNSEFHVYTLYMDKKIPGKSGGPAGGPPGEALEMAAGKGS